MYARAKRRRELSLKTAPGTLPRFPEEFSKYLLWDLGPMKPWEWAAMAATEYHTARHVQEAWRKGVADADAEARAEKHQASRGDG